jgi:hypothetical protein
MSFFDTNKGPSSKLQQTKMSSAKKYNLLAPSKRAIFSPKKHKDLRSRKTLTFYGETTIRKAALPTQLSKIPGFNPTICKARKKNLFPV